MSEKEMMCGSDPGREERIAEIAERGFAAAMARLDPGRHLVRQGAGSISETANYRPPESLPLAQMLLAKGERDSLAEAAAIVSAVLDSQELDPQHPHYGNWLWLADDPEVADLNAVQFVMRGLLPLLVQQGDRLSPLLLARCRQAVRLSLEEEERMDVAPSYSNIHIMSLLALLVGGEWLEDAHFQSLGRERWDRWVAYTLNSGAPYEYNSPGYGGVDLSALASLAALVRDSRIKLQAKLMYERLWLHAALHIHTPTGQLAGPHCRCYWGMMTTGRGAVKDLLWRETGWDWLLASGPYGEHLEGAPSSLELALTQHELPAYLGPVLQSQGAAMPYHVREVADVEQGYDLTTYLAPAYAMGTASKTYSIGTECFYIDHHANYWLLHYARPGKPGGWGMAYSRYVVNDRHWGELGAAPDRSKRSNFYDQGHFCGAQLGNKAIALYGLMREQDQVHSLKTVVAFQSGGDLDGVWLNDRRVEMADLPAEAEAGDWLVVADGQVYVGIHILAPSQLGRQAPILLERGPLGELWLTIYNYRGASKRFWEYASLQGAFWQGNIHAGFIAEVGACDDYASEAKFLAHLRRATISDTVDQHHIRTVRYSLGEDDLAVHYDLWRTEPAGREYNGQAYLAPNLDSPFAVQGASGELQAGGARLTSHPQQMVLVAQELAPEARCWVAMNPSAVETPLRLETPCGVVSVQSFGLGRLEWRAPEGGAQELVIEALAEPRGLQAPPGVSIVVRSPA